MLKLVLFVFYIAHFCSLIWYKIGLSGLSEGDSWLISEKIAGSSWKIKYISSLYFALVTMITVGYGDISPSTLRERIFVIVFMVFACGIFAYNLNRVGLIVQDLFQKEDEFRLFIYYTQFFFKVI